LDKFYYLPKKLGIAFIAIWTPRNSGEVHILLEVFSIKMSRKFFSRLLQLFAHLQL